MNRGQELSVSYILERVKEDKVEEAKALFVQIFKKQVEGNFTQDDIAQFIPKMISLLKLDKIEEVAEVMEQYARNFQSKITKFAFFIRLKRKFELKKEELSGENEALTFVKRGEELTETVNIQSINI